ncbi:MAG: ribonuclease HII [Clostridia bacterium]
MRFQQIKRRKRLCRRKYKRINSKRGKIMKEKELERLLNLKKEEKALYEKGIVSICGIDEAGRGPLAGPVVVACSLMPKDSMIEGVNDSKKIAEKKRERIYEEIIKEAIAYGVGIINQEEIDRINILNATKKGLTIAIKELEEKLEKQNLKRPEVILVDALTGIDTLGIPYKSIIHGDAISYSIACASIIAKVTRDRIMKQMDEIYPQYGFAKHKGYGTAAHMQAIRENGLCPIHRRSFVKNII